MVDMIRNICGLKESLNFNKRGNSFLYFCKMIASVKISKHNGTYGKEERMWTFYKDSGSTDFNVYIILAYVEIYVYINNIGYSCKVILVWKLLAEKLISGLAYASYFFKREDKYSSSC